MEPSSALGAADALDTPRDASSWFTLLYRELLRVARGEVFRHQALALGARTLLHEAWLRIAPLDLSFATRAELVAYSARVMRSIVVDHIRATRSLKRGREVEVIAYATLSELREMPADESLRIDEAVGALADVDPRLAELVELKFFAGLNFAEIAALREQSERTVQRDWSKARLLLRQWIEPA
ncbi:MAG TPA: sigma-70 family RNA polymerase sigma factor [Ideonella sp.]|nr:sigma-70 family RNA polymerase sigma factor [Ideonella sp.]